MENSSINAFCKACLVMAFKQIVDKFYDCYVYDKDHSLLVSFINRY